jgi:hypothetical protein
VPIGIAEFTGTDLRHDQRQFGDDRIYCMWSLVATSIQCISVDMVCM